MFGRDTSGVVQTGQHFCCFFMIGNARLRNHGRRVSIFRNEPADSGVSTS